MFSGVEFRFRKLGSEPGKGADEIVGNEDLAIAIGAGTDANGWDRNQLGDLARDRRSDEFEDDGKRARFGQSEAGRSAGWSAQLFQMGVLPV